MAVKSSLNRLFHRGCQHSADAKLARRPPGGRWRPRIEALEDRLTPSVDIWTGANFGVDNNWSDSLNWSLGAVPGAGDTALFNSSAQSSSANVDMAFSIAGLNIDSTWGGTINVNKNLTISGNLTMASGNLNISAALSIGGSASQLTGGFMDVLSGGTFTNSGTFTANTSNSQAINGFTNNGTWVVNLLVLSGPPANLPNFVNNGILDLPGGTIADDGVYNSRGFNSGSNFLNTGVIESTGTSFIGSALNGQANFDVQSGTLSWSGQGVTSQGSITVANQALLRMVGEAYSFTPSLTGTYTGFGTGTFVINRTIGLGGSTTFNFPAGMCQFSDSGRLSNLLGGQTVTLTNASGSFITVTAASGAGFTLSNACILENQGTITQTGSGNLEFADSSMFQNDVGGLYNFATDSGMSEGSLGGTATVINSGLIEKTAGSGTSAFTSDPGEDGLLNFNNTGGTVNVQTGTVVVGGGTSTGGTFSASAGATLAFFGHHTWSGSYTGSGAGLVSFEGTIFDGAQAPVLNFPSGLFHLGNNAVISSNYTLVNGVGGFITVDAVSGSEAGTNAGATLDNKGTISQTGSGSFLMGNNSTVINEAGATYDFLVDSGIGGLGSVINSGLIEKTSGTGTSGLPAFNNTGGTVNVQTGTVAVGGGTSTGGTFSASAGATLAFFGHHTWSGSYTGSGAGLVSFEGTIFDGAQAPVLNFPSGLFHLGNNALISSNYTLVNGVGGFITVDAASGSEAGTNAGATLDNKGTISQIGTGSFLMGNNSTVINEAGATYDFQVDSGIGGLGSVINSGLIEKTSGTGTSGLSAFNNTGGTVNVQTGTVVVGGGTSTGGTFSASAGATLAIFRNQTWSGSYTGSGAGLVSFEGTIFDGAQAPVLNFPSGLFHLGNNALISNNYTLVNGVGGFITVDAASGSEAGTNAGATLDNKGTISQTGTGSFLMGNNSTVINEAGATYDFQVDSGIGGLGSVINSGLMEKTSGTGTSGLPFFSNTGTVAVHSGTFDVAGTAQVSGSTLSGGKWDAIASSNVSATLVISSPPNLTAIGAGTTVELSGPNASFTNLAGLNAISGKLKVLRGASLAVPADLTVNKNAVLEIGAGSTVSVPGNFDLIAKAILQIGLGGTNSHPAIGQLQVSGTTTLAGKLKMTATRTPSVGSAFTILDNLGNTAISGIFAGLPEGSTIMVNGMTFRISYNGGAGHSVTLTRIS